ncbi:MAG: hypothetical protein ACPLQP_08240 [Moorellaceae bacterium]
MIKRTAIIIFFFVIMVWGIVAGYLHASLPVFITGALLIAYFMYNIAAPPVSSYFRLVRKSSRVDPGISPLGLAYPFVSPFPLGVPH